MLDVCLVSISEAFDSVGCDTLQLIGLRTEGQTQMPRWASSAADSRCAMGGTTMGWSADRSM